MELLGKNRLAKIFARSMFARKGELLGGMGKFLIRVEKMGNLSEIINYNFEKFGKSYEEKSGNSSENYDFFKVWEKVIESGKNVRNYRKMGNLSEILSKSGQFG